MKKMNKNGFIEKLSARLSYSSEKCTVINGILEENFFISKKSKVKIIDELIRRLEISECEAEQIYSVSVEIINDEVKNKLKRPFGSQNR